ncbi:hypothetical protein [Pseudodesulfovibrio sp.]|uniref:hypothetical protein n=1 Tax=Pseudodesulfovibrio sp. TaxID=2035812 RepID=UPI00261C8888|nr:hypothetical protein [Pseudodesulfovibrio sp.]MDD3310712.1 hypothetical protein [Pseudodesulfovibrio sp.]
MKEKNRINGQGAAFCLLRLAVIALVAVIGGVSCSGTETTPKVLQWHLLEESPHKPVLKRLYKADFDSTTKFGWDPEKVYYVAAMDINDDGLDELFITTGIPLMSGAEGSWIDVYSPTANGDWIHVPYSVITHYSPRILQTKTNGFHDIAAWNSLVAFEEGAYRRTQGIDPAQYHLGKELSPENLLPHIWEQCCSGQN